VTRAGVLACAGALVAAAGVRAQAPEVPVAAVSEYGSVAPGGALRVAVRLDVPDGWGVDWINPGTVGLPITLGWHVPAAWSAGATQWPYPERHEAEGDVTHVLHGAVYVVTPFHVAGDAKPGSAELRADLTWLLCSTECIRQQRTVSVPVRVVRGGAGGAATAVTAAWTQVEAAAGRFPASGEGVTLRVVRSADSVRLEIAGLRGAPPAGSLVTFFPAAQGRAAVVAPLRRSSSGVAVVLPAGFVAGAPSPRLAGVLVGLLVRSGAATSRALAVDVPVAER
jgi:thiol:disulfide interchange protein DsbD